MLDLEKLRDGISQMDIDDLERLKEKLLKARRGEVSVGDLDLPIPSSLIPDATVANLFELYENSVQSPDVDVELIDRVFAYELGGPPPQTLKEDFCGTGLISSTYLQSDPKRRAVGLDLDPESMKYGRERHFESDLADRMSFIQQDVCDFSTEAMPDGLHKFDVVYAGNYSFSVFKTRRALLQYFTAARSFIDRGVFIMELMGGPDCQIAAEDEPRELELDGGMEFSYVWRQESFNPVTNELMAHIDFSFPDGSELPAAFTYDWRLWSIVELREALEEAGFGRTVVYHADLMEDRDDGIDAGSYTRTVRGEDVEQSAAWLAYLVAVVE